MDTDFRSHNNKNKKQTSINFDLSITNSLSNKHLEEFTTNKAFTESKKSLNLNKNLTISSIHKCRFKNKLKVNLFL